MIFKKLCQWSVLFFLCIGSVNAQCDNNVNTDPDNATNDALPVDLTHPSGDDRYLNGTNWFPLTPGGGFEDYDLSNMMWSGVPLAEMDNIWSSPLSHYQYINDSPRPIPKNGWELLLVNLGRYPNDVDIADSNETFQALPYIVIYNRYSGIVRVFANFGLDQLVGDGPDAVEVVMSFVLNEDNTGSTGLARLYSGKDMPLDKPTKVTTMKALAKATNAQRQWFSTDFQIAYDPCTCYFPSQIRIHFNQIKEESLELHGRSLSVTDNLINPDLQINPMDFLSGFDYTGNDENKGGILIYKGLQGLVDDYIERLEKYKLDLEAANRHNKVVEHNLNALKVLKYALTAIFTYGINAQAIDTSGMIGQEWWTKIKDQYGSFIKTSNKINIENLLKIAKKILGSDAKTYIEQNFEKMPLPSAPDPKKVPSVTFTEMHFQGLISDSEIKGGPTFYTPGTYGTEATKVLDLSTPDPDDKIDPILETMYEYPVYNEVLGSFALLNSPKITLTKRYVPDSASESDNLIETNYGTLQQVFYKSWSNEYQIKIDNDLMFAFNKALDIEDYEIKAAFRFKAQTKAINTNGQNFNTFIDPNYTTNVSSTSYNVDTYDIMRKYSNTEYTNSVEDGWGPDPDWEPSEYETPYGEAPALFQTPFVPLDAFYNFITGVGQKQEFFQFSGAFDYLHETTQGVGLEFYDIELVLSVDIKFNTENDHGLKNTSTQILSYDILPEQIEYHTENYTYTELDPTLASSLDMGTFNENIHLGDILFDGSPVENCTLVGNVYTCRAWNDIYIEGNLSTTGSYVANIIAGNNIFTSPESTTDPETNLWIETPYDTSHPMIHASPTDVSTFCNTKYKANFRDPDITGKTAFNKNVGEQESVKGNSLLARLYPNPADGHVNVSLTGVDNETVNIAIYGILGKRYKLPIQKERISSYRINTESLNTGMYFIKITSSNGFTKTLKLIIN